MYTLITTKGRKSAADLATLAAWLDEMQPSSTRIAHGDSEAEVEWSDDEPENDLRWALRLEEAAALDLTVNNDNIYLAGLGRGHAHLIYLRRDVACVTLMDNTNEVSRELRDDETLAEVLAAVQRGE